MSAIALSLVALERAQRRSRAAKPASMSLDQVDDLTRAKLGSRLVARSEPCTRSTSPAVGHGTPPPTRPRPRPSEHESLQHGQHSVDRSASGVVSVTSRGAGRKSDTGR